MNDLAFCFIPVGQLMNDDVIELFEVLRFVARHDDPTVTSEQGSANSEIISIMSSEKLAQFEYFKNILY